MYAIKTENLTKKYKDLVAVDGLHLEIPKGELFALLGVNGAGKTTAIKMLTGLTQPTAGDAYLQGKIAVSPQETAIAPGLTVAENLELIAGVYGFSKAQRREKIGEISDQLGLGEILHKKAGKLSGGWQRRLSIAMALISEPEILFLDEPTLGLDVLARQELWDFISGLKGHVTILLTTHYLEEAEHLSDRIGIMKDGRLLVCGTVGELKEMAQTDNFQEAFVKIIREAKQ